MRPLNAVLSRVGCTVAVPTITDDVQIRKCRYSKPSVALAGVGIFFMGSLGKLLWDIHAPARAMVQANAYCRHWGFDGMSAAYGDWGCVVQDEQTSHWVSIIRAPDFELEAMNAKQRLKMSCNLKCERQAGHKQ